MVEPIKYQVKFRLWEEIPPPTGQFGVRLFCCMDEPLGIILRDRGSMTDARLYRVWPVGEPDELEAQTYIKGINIDDLLIHFASVYERTLKHENQKRAR